jgi:hypothetical protein
MDFCLVVAAIHRNLVDRCIGRASLGAVANALSDIYFSQIHSLLDRGEFDKATQCLCFLPSRGSQTQEGKAGGQVRVFNILSPLGVHNQAQQSVAHSAAQVPYIATDARLKTQ